MNISNKLQLRIGKEQKTVCFGVPNTEEELGAMFKLRHDVYKSKGYIDAKQLHNGLEKDSYDTEGKCYYFIAKVDDKIIGTARLIKDDELPIKKECFEFETPALIKKFPKEQRIELGRLIVIPYDSMHYFPRNLVLMFLINSVIGFCENKNFAAGYAFVTKPLLKKFEKLRIPVRKISQYLQKYPKDGLLYMYFNKRGNPIVPIYFIRDEVKKYIEEVINKRKMFQKIDESNYILKPNLYNKFLRLMKIL